jgi:Sodium:sulfate symporter transmembrane region
MGAATTVRNWAITQREIIVAELVLIALLLWIFGASYINATAVALLAISLMLLTGSFSWADILEYKSAWNTLAWFATLVALADGLNRVGFVEWFAESIAHHLIGISPTTAMVIWSPCSSSRIKCCRTAGRCCPVRGAACIGEVDSMVYGVTRPAPIRANRACVCL